MISVTVKCQIDSIERPRVQRRLRLDVVGRDGKSEPIMNRVAVHHQTTSTLLGSNWAVLCQDRVQFNGSDCVKDVRLLSRDVVQRPKLKIRRSRGLTERGQSQRSTVLDT